MTQGSCCLHSHWNRWGKAVFKKLNQRDFSWRNILYQGEDLIAFSIVIALRCFLVDVKPTSTHTVALLPLTVTWAPPAGFFVKMGKTRPQRSHLPLESTVPSRAATDWPSFVFFGRRGAGGLVFFFVVVNDPFIFFQIKSSESCAQCTYYPRDKAAHSTPTIALWTGQRREFSRTDSLSPGRTASH